MAEEHKEEGSPFAMLWVILGIFALLIIVWLMRHDPKTTNVGGLFITLSPPTIPGITPPMGDDTLSPSPSALYFSSPDLAKIPRSPWYGSVMIENYGGAQASNPQEEYVTLYAPSTDTKPVDLSGWQLKSAISGKIMTIGRAVEAPRLGIATQTGVIEFLTGQTAIVSSGRSPIGVSFLENECTGYLNQFQSFTPTLPLSCPFPNDELARSGLSQDTMCAIAADSLAPCQALTGAPTNVSPSCSAFLAQRLTYNGCVAAHAADGNFEGNEWRLYLGSAGELWSNSGDTIVLLDAQGRLVGGISY